MIVRMLKDDSVSFTGLERIILQKGKTYTIPDAYAHGVVRKGTGVEIIAEIQDFLPRLFVATPVHVEQAAPPLKLQPPVRHVPEKKGFFSRIFKR